MRAAVATDCLATFRSRGLNMLECCKLLDNWYCNSPCRTMPVDLLIWESLVVLYLPRLAISFRGSGIAMGDAKLPTCFSD